MRTTRHPRRAIRNLPSVAGAGILALLLVGVPLAAHGDELSPEASPVAVEVPLAAEAVAPVITSGPLGAGVVGEPYAFQLTSNVSPVTFSVSGLPDGLQADAQSGLISGTPTTDGEFAVRLEAIGTEPSDITQVRYDTLVIEPAPVTVPVITSPPPPGGTVGVPYSFQVTSNVSAVTFSITGLPDGLTADAGTGLISGTPTTDGEYTVRLEAIGTEPTGGITQVVYATVIIEPAPVTVPVITSPTPPGGTVGVPYSFQVTSNVSPVSFSIIGLPDGLSADAETGLISGTPATSGDFVVSLEAIGAVPTGGISQIVYVTLTIAPSTADVPAIISGTPPDGTVGVAYSFLVVSSVAGATFTAEGLPGGLTIDATTGLISGTPTTAGPATVVLTATAGGLSSDPVTYPITIAPPVTPPVTPPVFTSVAPDAATVGTAFSYLPVVTSETPVTFTLAGAAPGLSFDPATGRLTGTPTTAGTYLLTIVASNGASASTSQSFTLVVAPATTAPPTTPPTTPPTQNPPVPSVVTSPPAQAVASVPPANLPTAVGAASGSGYGGTSTSTLADTGARGSEAFSASLLALLLLAVGAAIVRRTRSGRRA